MKNKKGNVALIAIIVIVVAITAGVIGWMLAKKTQVATQQVAPTQSNNTNQQVQKPEKPAGQNLETSNLTGRVVNDNQVSSETTGWNSYTNKNYGYTIKYPKNYFVDATSSENPITKRGPEEAPNYIGGDTTWSNQKDISSFQLGTAPKDLQSIFLLIFKADPSKTLDEFVTAEHFEFEKKEYLQVNGIQGLLLTCSTEGETCPDTNIEHIMLMKNGLVFQFSNGNDGKNNTILSKKILETMIATFKFSE